MSIQIDALAQILDEFDHTPSGIHYSIAANELDKLAEKLQPAGDLKIDVSAAQAFLDSVAAAARHKFAIVKPGEVVVVQADRVMTDEAFNRSKQLLGSAAANLGIKLLLMPAGFKVAQCA